MRNLFILLCLGLILCFSNNLKGYDDGLDLPVDPNSKKALPPGPPPSPPAPPDRPEDEDEPPSVFGQELHSKNGTIIYVIDISGSMGADVRNYTKADGTAAKGDRLDRAKSEMVKSIVSLPDNFKFNIYAYDCLLAQWQAGLVEANQANKNSAIGWTMKLEPGGGTGTGPAVAVALAIKENTLVVLLTDGAPNCMIGGISGDTQSPEEHRAIIKMANTQGVTIDVFGISCFGIFEIFCRNVAIDSGGIFIKVD